MTKRSTAVATIMAGASLAAVPAMAQNLNYSTYIPASEQAVIKGFEPMFAAVSEATDGAFSAQLFTAGQMFGPLDTLPGIQSGAVGGGTVFAGFYGNELPHSAMLEDTVALNDDRVATVGAALETYFHDCPGCQEETVDAGIVVLGGHALPPYLLLCSTEIASIDDLQGLRIRGSTGMMNSAIQLMGANGVNIAFGEIPQAFERGNIDCMIGNESWMSIFGLTEIVESSVPQPTLGMAPSSTFVTFSGNFWSGLSDETKAAFIDYMPTYAADVTMGYLEADRAARDAAIAEGMQEVDLGEGFAEMREELRSVERERILETAASRGVEDPEALLSAYEANYAKWLDLSAEIDNDPVAFADALRENVYADLDL